jgi:hypothetical protein
MKQCSRCKVMKNTSDFEDGQKKCRTCKKYVLDYYEKNKSKEIARAIKSQKNQGRDVINAYKRELNRRNPENYILQGARQRAKKDGLPFDLTRDDIIIPTICPVLGCELKMSSGKPSNCSPSIDRIQPELGYVKGNVRIISWRANDVKGNATIEELQKILAYMISELAKKLHMIDILKPGSLCK